MKILAGDRITLVADPKRGVKQETGTILCAVKDMVIVQLDSEFFLNEEDDGLRDVPIKDIVLQEEPGNKKAKGQQGNQNSAHSFTEGMNI